MNYKLGDFDVWYKDCVKCGFKTGKATQKLDNRCWKCGSRLERDFSDRAIKKQLKESKI